MCGHTQNFNQFSMFGTQPLISLYDRLAYLNSHFQGVQSSGTHSNNRNGINVPALPRDTRGSPLPGSPQISEKRKKIIKESFSNPLPKSLRDIMKAYAEKQYRSKWDRIKYAQLLRYYAKNK